MPAPGYEVHRKGSYRLYCRSYSSSHSAVNSSVRATLDGPRADSDAGDMASGRDDSAGSPLKRARTDEELRDGACASPPAGGLAPCVTVPPPAADAEPWPCANSAEGPSPPAPRALDPGCISEGTAVYDGPEITADSVKRVMACTGCGEDEVRLAMQKFLAKTTFVIEWLQSKSAEEKGAVIHRHAEERRKELEDMKIARRMQQMEEQEERDVQENIKRANARDTATRTGIIGDMFERGRRPRNDGQGFRRQQPVVVSGPSQGAGRAARGSGRAARVSLEEKAQSVFLDGEFETILEHDYLQKPVMFKGKFGRVVEAFKGASGAVVMLVRTLDGTLDYVEEWDFVWNADDHYIANSTKVLLLPRAIQLRGCGGSMIGPGEPNLFFFEDNVVCEMPASTFGPRFEYIPFQTFSADQEGVTLQVRLGVENKLHLARRTFDQPGSLDEGPVEREKTALSAGTPFKLRIFDTDNCYCRQVPEACICKKGRGWGVRAEQDIAKGSIVSGLHCVHSVFPFCIRWICPLLSNSKGQCKRRLDSYHTKKIETLQVCV